MWHSLDNLNVKFHEYGLIANDHLKFKEVD